MRPADLARGARPDRREDGPRAPAREHPRFERAARCLRHPARADDHAAVAAQDDRPPDPCAVLADLELDLDAYWRRFPGIWTHGDWASIDDDGYWFLHGRSDDTLNIAGKRVGPAELESAVVAHPAVTEAAAVGVPHEVKGEVAWIFCCLVQGAEPGEDLARELGELVALDLGKAFAPQRVLFVPALPKTRSAKIVRRAVRATALGQDPGDLSSVENPDSLTAVARAVGSGS